MQQKQAKRYRTKNLVNKLPYSSRGCSSTLFLKVQKAFLLVQKIAIVKMMDNPFL